MKSKLHGCVADAQANHLREFLQIPKLNSYFFVGPPGCGKTFICEAFAHELMDKDYKFISILGSDIISKYAGTQVKVDGTEYTISEVKDILAVVE